MCFGMQLLGLIAIIKQLFKGESSMSKDQIVSDAVAALQAGEVTVLGGVYDSSFAEGVASVPPPDAGEQAKIDAAVAAAVAPLNQQISDLGAKDASDLQAAADAKVASDAAIASLQQQLSDLASAKGIEDGVIAGLQSSISSIQGALASLQALFPAPAPVPAA